MAVQSTSTRRGPKLSADHPASGVDHSSEGAGAALSPLGIGFAIAGAFLFSTKPIFIKLAYQYPIDAATLMTLRMAFSLPFFLIFAVIALRQRALQGKQTDTSFATLAKACGVGVIGYYLASYLDLEGLTLITAQFERLILFTFPVFVGLFVWWFFGERPSRRFAIAVGLSYGGLVLIFLRDRREFGGDVVNGALLVLGAAIAFALYLVWSKPLIGRMGSRFFTCIALIAASAVIGVHFLLSHPVSALVLPAPIYVIALMLAVIATVIPSLLIGEAIARIGPRAVSVTGGIGPVFTTLVAVLALNEPFTPVHAVGMLLVVGGIVFLSRRRP